MAPRPTRTIEVSLLDHLRGLDEAGMVRALASLFPAGRHAAVDARGHTVALDVFITVERRGSRRLPCGVRVIANGCEFSLDDGCDEFARVRLVGAPAFDPNGNVQISAVRHGIEGRRRGSSLWLAHDLSMLAVDDELVHLR